MAYARWSGNSDVHFSEAFDGTFKCLGCTCGIRGRREAIKHLQGHRDRGDRVPQYAFDQLRKELRCC